MAITPTTLSDSAVPSFSAPQDGDLTFWERAGVPGKVSYLALRSALGANAWTWTGNWTWQGTLTNPADFRTSLGLGDVATESVVPVAKGGTGATSAAAARNTLGLGAVANDNVVPVARGGTGATDAATARTNLGLGAVATDSVVPLARGGTGATSAPAARTALGLGDLSTRNTVGAAQIDDLSVGTAELATNERLNTANVSAAMAALGPMGLGDFAFLHRTSSAHTEIDLGVIYSGGELQAAGFWIPTSTSTVQSSTNVGALGYGSWVALGAVYNRPSASFRPATLFRRVAL